MEDTTADGAIGTQVIIVGTADGDGGAADLTRGGCFSHQSFRSHFLILTTADTDMGRDMATDQGMDTEEDTDLDLDRRFPRLPVNLFLAPFLSFHPYTIDARSSLAGFPHGFYVGV